MNRQPIGILDSGVGGLTVWKEIYQLLPNQATIFIGDSYNAPYGPKSPEEIFYLASNMVQFLITKEVKLIVIACNTITLNSIEKLREAFPQITFVGTVPVLKAAAAETKNKKIGLLATTAGAKSTYIQKLLETYAKDCQATIVATDAIVPLIEKGEMGEPLRIVLEKAFIPFQKAGIDTLVLGSTHFPFITTQMQEVLGDQIKILDSGEAIARQVEKVIESRESKDGREGEEDNTYTFFTTGDKKQFTTSISSLAGESFVSEKQPLIESVHI